MSQENIKQGKEIMTATLPTPCFPVKLRQFSTSVGLLFFFKSMLIKEMTCSEH